MADFATPVVCFFDSSLDDATTSAEETVDHAEGATQVDEAAPVSTTGNEPNQATNDSAGPADNSEMGSLSKVTDVELAGDAKHVRLPDRFFVELVMVSPGNNDELPMTIAPVFVAKTNRLDWIVRDCVANAPPLSSWELVVPCKDNPNSFQMIKDAGMTMEEASQCQTLECFGRLMVRHKKG